MTGRTDQMTVGTPEEVASIEGSYTGIYLSRLLEKTVAARRN